MVRYRNAVTCQSEGSRSAPWEIEHPAHITPQALHNLSACHRLGQSLTGDCVDARSPRRRHDLMPLVTKPFHELGSASARLALLSQPYTQHASDINRRRRPEIFAAKLDVPVVVCFLNRTAQNYRPAILRSVRSVETRWQMSRISRQASSSRARSPSSSGFVVGNVSSVVG